MPQSSFVWHCLGIVWHCLAKNFLHGPKPPLMETKTQIDTGKSEEVVRKHREYIWPAVANFYEHPLVADRARMQYVWDLEGRKYLDFFGGILTDFRRAHQSQGHFQNQGAGRSAAAHLHTVSRTSPWWTLAEKIAQIAPGKLQKSFFSNSGTEANEAALLLARMARDRSTLLGCGTAIRGLSALARSVTGQSTWRAERRDQRWCGPRDQSVLLPLPAGP